MLRRKTLRHRAIQLALLGLVLAAGGCYLLDEDLSLPAWGPYAVDQIGPVFIADRDEGQAVMFPVVVGQANGVDETRNLIFHRQWFGFHEGRMGTWKVLGTEANKQLTYWSYRIIFGETGFHDWTVPNLPGWDAGEAQVECARVGNDMLVAVTFTNEDTVETYRYFADLLGGLDPYYQSLPPENALVTKNVDEGWMGFEHPDLDVAFAVRARGAEAHLHDIRDDYFHPGVVTGTGGLGMHDDATYVGEGAGWWLDLNLAGIEVPPGEGRTVYYAIKIGAGLQDAVAGATALLDRAETEMALARLRHANLRYSVQDPVHRDVIEHAVSQILINPIYYGRVDGDLRFIPYRQRFFTPSRYFGIYMHWDAGCISLGLMEYDPLLAAENLDTALPDLDPTFLPERQPWPMPPTGIFALWEHYQLTHDMGVLRHLYPAAREWFLFTLQQGLEGDEDALLDWQGEGPNGEPYLYSMGSGMDDLPVWEYAKIAGPGGTLRHVEPPCIQSLYIRAAKVLRLMARALGGLEADIVEYTALIEAMGTDLQAYLWNADRGIFQPVWQDTNLPLGDYEDTVIAVYPLITGPDMITQEQKDGLIAYMTDPDTLWSGFGIRTVSRSAPYYVPYLGWWGGVWVPPQWFAWKSLLTFGEVDLARELVRQVLENHRWNHEERPYLVEMVNGDTGVSMGAQDFTGLSSPIIHLHASYHTPGHVSGGWETWIHASAYEAASDRLTFTASAPDVPGPSGFVVVMGAPDTDYRVTVGAGSFTLQSDESGALGFVSDLGEAPAQFVVERVSPDA